MNVCVFSLNDEHFKDRVDSNDLIRYFDGKILNYRQINFEFAEKGKKITLNLL